eukprot:scpid102576/ scgid20629/ 
MEGAPQSPLQTSERNVCDAQADAAMATEESDSLEAWRKKKELRLGPRPKTAKGNPTPVGNTLLNKPKSGKVEIIDQTPKEKTEEELWGSDDDEETVCDDRKAEKVIIIDNGQDEL